MCNFGLTDTFRQFNDEDKVFSWWDYRGGAFHKGHGMRIDLLLATPSVAARAKGSVIDRNARKERDSGKPSDHVPVILEVG